MSHSDSDDDIPPAVPPLDGWHRAMGARMVPFAGYLMPVQYAAGILAEHRQTREAASLFDVSHMGQLLVSGEDAPAALEALTPSDVAGLAQDRLRYSLLLSHNGGILDDLMITHRRDGYYLVVNGATKIDDIAHLREELPDEVTLNHMDDHALLALQGPKAVDALDRLAPGVGRLGFMTAGAFELLGAAAWISRSGYTGEDGFEISLPAARAQRVAEALCGQPEVEPAGLGARDSLRLEAGLPLYGHDLDEETTPVEAALAFAIARRRREEGGFPGAERIAFELAEGPARRRVGLLVEGRQPVREGALVLDIEGEEVGRVTSGGFSPTLGRPIAMGFVPATLAAPGTHVSLASRGKIFAAEVAAMPFVPHRYVRQGGPS
jgi:aminomethyltransferase